MSYYPKEKYYLDDTDKLRKPNPTELERELRENEVFLIVSHIRCELSKSVNALSVQYPWLKNWRAKFDLSLAVENQQSLVPTSTAIAPIASGVFGLIGKGRLNSTATRTALLKFGQDLKYNNLKSCEYSNSGHYSDGRVIPSLPNVRGNIGIYHWMQVTIQAVVGSKQGTPGDIDTMGQTVNFVTEFGGSIDPSITITKVNGRVNGGNSLLDLGRKETNSIIMAITAKTENPADADSKLNGIINDLRVQQNNDQQQR